MNPEGAPTVEDLDAMLRQIYRAVAQLDGLRNRISVLQQAMSRFDESRKSYWKIDRESSGA